MSITHKANELTAPSLHHWQNLEKSEDWKRKAKVKCLFWCRRGFLWHYSSQLFCAWICSYSWRTECAQTITASLLCCTFSVNTPTMFCSAIQRTENGPTTSLSSCTLLSRWCAALDFSCQMFHTPTRACTSAWTLRVWNVNVNAKELSSTSFSVGPWRALSLPSRPLALTPHSSPLKHFCRHPPPIPIPLRSTLSPWRCFQWNLGQERLFSLPTGSCKISRTL